MPLFCEMQKENTWTVRKERLLDPRVYRLISFRNDYEIWKLALSASAFRVTGQALCLYFSLKTIAILGQVWTTERTWVRERESLKQSLLTPACKSIFKAKEAFDNVSILKSFIVLFLFFCFKASKVYWKVKGLCVTREGTGKWAA